MTMMIAVMAILFFAGGLLGLVSRWLIVCLCEGALLVVALMLALVLGKPLLATSATLLAGFVAMQTAYIMSGMLAEFCRYVAQFLKGSPADRFTK